MIEKLFDMTEFEQSLKEHADDFTIVPSRKVWQGIYNNMHPGKRWPSIPMAFMLLLSLMGIGYLNNAPVNGDHNEIVTNKESLTTASNKIHQKNTGSKLTIASINKEFNDNNFTLDTVSLSKAVNPEVSFVKGNLYIAEEKMDDQLLSKTKVPVPENTSSLDLKSLSSSIENTNSIQNEDMDILTNNDSNISSKNPIEKAEVNQNEKAASLITKSITRKTPKIVFSYFIMPTVTNAYFASNAVKDIKTEGSLLTVNPNLSPTNNMIVNAQLGLRLGGQVEYRINSKFQLLMMGQVSYSGYTIISNNEALVTGKLALKDKTGPVYSKAYYTSYGNGKSENQVPLKNYSLQVSIPVGMQYELWKNKSAGIFVSTAAGPSFVLKSNAHILSSDGRNYVDDQSLMRTTNYSGYLGTHVEFNAKNLKWRIGPTVSYQLLSTYEDKYPVKEHLIDYGIKIGISK